jgi:hypothetical protein
MADSWWKPSWLFGGGGAEGAPLAPAAFGANRPYPSQEDLEFARKQGEFQHTGEFTPNTFQITKGQYRDQGTEGIRLDTALGALGPPTDQGMIDALGRSKLGAHRSAIVSLAAGDPKDQVVVSPDLEFEDFYGMTRHDPRGIDPLFTFVGKTEDRDPSTATHEAAHRGFYKVLEALKNQPDTENNRRVMEYLVDPNTNELAVRALMHDALGDPEAGNRSQRFTNFVEGQNRGIINPGEDLEYARRMNALAEALAQKMVHDRKPGGPW